MQAVVNLKFHNATHKIINTKFKSYLVYISTKLIR